jgi:hypothetical protein
MGHVSDGIFRLQVFALFGGGKIGTGRIVAEGLLAGRAGKNHAVQRELLGHGPDRIGEHRD